MKKLSPLATKGQGYKQQVRVAHGGKSSESNIKGDPASGSIKLPPKKTASYPGTSPVKGAPASGSSNLSPKKTTSYPGTAPVKGAKKK